MKSLRNNNNYNTRNVSNESQGFRLTGKTLSESCSTAPHSRMQLSSLARHQCPVRKIDKKKKHDHTSIARNLRLAIKKKKKKQFDFSMLWRTKGVDREMCEWIFDVLAPRSQVMLCADPPRMLGKGSSGSKGRWNTAEWGISGLRRSLGILPR